MMTMPCIVVGGVADGVFLPEVDAEAEIIELSRPEYVKPLMTPGQEQPEVEKESGLYEVHPLGIAQDVVNYGEARYTVYGIAVPEGTSLDDAIGILFTSYVQLRTNEEIAQRLKDNAN